MCIMRLLTIWERDEGALDHGKLSLRKVTPLVVKKDYCDSQSVVLVIGSLERGQRCRIILNSSVVATWSRERSLQHRMWIRHHETPCDSTKSCH